MFGNEDEKTSALRETRELEKKNVDDLWKDLDRLVKADAPEAQIEGVESKYRQANAKFDRADNAYRSHLEEKLQRGNFTNVYTPEVKVTGMGAAFVDAMREQYGEKAFDGTSGGATLPVASFDPRIRSLPTRNTFIRSVLPVQPIEGSDKVAYVAQVSPFTNSAAQVANAALKPTSAMSVQRLEAPVVTVAHLSEGIPRQLLEDGGQSLSDFVDMVLRTGVLRKSEDDILNSSGTPKGILQTTGIGTQARGTDSRLDAIRKAITKVQLSAYSQPNVVILHPTDAETLAVEKSADAHYYSDPLAATDPNRVWGIELIVSPAITAGTGLVMDTSYAQVWQRNEVRVTFTEYGLNEAGDDMFSRNLLRFRAEERLSWGLLYAGAACKVTGL